MFHKAKEWEMIGHAPAIKLMKERGRLGITVEAGGVQRMKLQREAITKKATLKSYLS